MYMYYKKEPRVTTPCPSACRHHADDGHSECLQLRWRDGRVRLSQQVLGSRLEIEDALVLVRVAMLAAEEVLALALEAGQANLLVA